MNNNQKVLLTGGAGFIGSHVGECLLKNGYQVLCIDNFNDYYDPAMKRRNIADQIDNPRYLLADADIRDKELMKNIIDDGQPAAIIHLAARAGVRPSIEQVELYQSTNISGTLNILEAAKSCRVKKFIFASSSSVYGLNEKVPFNESDSLLKPASPYAATKIAGEALCHTYAHLYELPIVALRFFTVYGPRQRPDLAIRKFFEKIWRQEPIVLYGDGSSSRDYTYVDDIVNGVMAALNYEVGTYEVFNLGNSSPISLNTLIQSIEKISGRQAILLYEGNQPGDVPITYADIGKAQSLLNYYPRIQLEVGLARTGQWLLSQSPGNEGKVWRE